MQQLLNLQDAAEWATEYLDKQITTQNISYLIQYGKVRKTGENGQTQIFFDDLKKYYDFFVKRYEAGFKQKLGNDLNWTLSFANLTEKERTKHVHRLHPYKGKFIPQLVEYFLDAHTDNFKKQTFFKKGDVVLDPFSGSGTTLVQANELGIHSVGIDVSRFNSMIAECKLEKYNLNYLKKTLCELQLKLNSFNNQKLFQFERELEGELTNFNNKYFPCPQFKYDLNAKKVNEEIYAKEKVEIFKKKFWNLIKKHGIDIFQNENKTFLDRWFVDNVRREMDFVFNLIKNEKDTKTKKILAIILSRTIRSCRATTHSDLATLKTPQFETYYCFKHKKICKPLFSMKKMFNRYAFDTPERLQNFDHIRTSFFSTVITADSRTVDIFYEVKKRNRDFYDLLSKQKISGIFSSPPYVGQIDYHEQHSYAYDLFGFARKDELEIGPLFKGQGEEARKSYIDGIVDVLNNCKKYLAIDYNVLLVANDKYNLYPEIAYKSGMKIINQFKRPVLNRTERDRSPYSEIIFHFKNN